MYRLDHNLAGEAVKLADGLQSCSAYGGIVGPMITYLLPVLIGYTGGKMLYDVRGGVVAQSPPSESSPVPRSPCSWAR